MEIPDKPRACEKFSLADYTISASGIYQHQQLGIEERPLTQSGVCVPVRIKAVRVKRRDNYDDKHRKRQHAAQRPSMCNNV